MKLRLGQSVNSTDGPFGALSDIVVDPNEKAVTHIIVEPTLGYYQSRLVPIWLVTDDEAGALTVELDEAHLRQLQRVSFSDYERQEQDVELDETWDVSQQEVVTIRADLTSLEGLDPEIDLADYESVPRSDCEIRSTCEVVCSDGFVVGRVNGFLADRDRLAAVVVRVGPAGLRHDVLVPFSAVDTVFTDRVGLLLSRAEFFALPLTSALGQTEADVSRVRSIRRTIERTAARADVQRHRVALRAKTRLSKAVSSA